VLATINAIAERLTDERGLVYRYDTRGGADGLEGREGTLVLCTFWLARAQALALAGQPAGARHVFERAITYPNDAGLLAEEVDPAAGELPGNFPQAFSHIGLIDPAWAISEPGRRQASSPGRLTGPVPAFPPARRGSGHDPAAPQARPARGHACYVVPVRRHRRPQAGGLPHTRAADRIDRWHCHGFGGRGLRIVDGIAGCDEAGDDPRDVALGDAQRRGGSGGVAPAVGSCDAGST
jgi:glycosyl hydrolase family 15